MSFFSFLGKSLATGYKPMDDAENMVLDTKAKRAAIPYELAMKRDAASNSRVTATENVERAAANTKAREAAAGFSGGRTAVPLPNTDFNIRAGGGPAMQPMPAAAAPAAPTTTIPEPSARGEKPDFYGSVAGSSPRAGSLTDRALQQLFGRVPTPEEAVALLNKGIKDLDAQIGAGIQANRSSRAGGGVMPNQKLTAERERLIALRDQIKPKKPDPVWFGAKPNTSAVNLPSAAPTAPMVEGNLTSYPTDLRPKGTAAPTSGPTFDEAMEAIKRFEGGLSMNPDDRGNWTGGEKGKGVLKGTKYGISAASYPNLDIKNLTPEQAKQIYKRDYWDKIGADSLPGEVRLSAFDAAVNQGPKFATDTLAATGGDPAAFAAARKQRYSDIVVNDPSQAQFAGGWDARTEAAAALTPGQALVNGTGQPGLNTEPYLQDPEALSLDLQTLNVYQQEMQTQYAQLERYYNSLSQAGNYDDPRGQMAQMYDLESKMAEMRLAATQSMITEATLYAYQGLNLAQGGDTSMLNQALSTITGVGHEITPYEGGFYALRVAGQPISEAPVPYDQLVQEVRTRIDRGYAESLSAARAEMASEMSLKAFEQRGAIDLALVEGRVGAERDINKVQAEALKEMTVAQFEAQLGGRYVERGKDAEGNQIVEDLQTRELLRPTLRQTGKGRKAVSTLILEPYLTEGQ